MDSGGEELKKDVIPDSGRRPPVLGNVNVTLAFAQQQKSSSLGTAPPPRSLPDQRDGRDEGGDWRRLAAAAAAAVSWHGRSSSVTVWDSTNLQACSRTRPIMADCRPSTSLVSLEWMMAIRRDACITPGQSELCPTPRCRHQASRGTPRSPLRAAAWHTHTPNMAPWPVARRPWMPPHPTSRQCSYPEERTHPPEHQGSELPDPWHYHGIVKRGPAHHFWKSWGYTLPASFDISARIHGNCGPRSGARSPFRQTVLARESL